MLYAPIIVTVYDRLKHLHECIAALQQNAPATESELYLVSDGPAKPEHASRIDQVREYARSIGGFKKTHLVFRERNFGAYDSFLAITDQVVKAHGRFIFLEDDVIASPSFLEYMNDGLGFYETDPRIFSVAAYTLPVRFPKKCKARVFFLPSNCPWGFAVWRDRWEKVDFGEKNRHAIAVADKKLNRRLISTGSYMMQTLQADSQGRIRAPDVRVAFHQFVHEVYTVYPRISKVVNIGLDGSGMHSGKDKNNKFRVEADLSNDKTTFEADVRLDSAILRRIRTFQNGSPIERLVKFVLIARKRWREKNLSERDA